MGTAPLIVVHGIYVRFFSLSEIKLPTNRLIPKSSEKVFICQGRLFKRYICDEAYICIQVTGSSQM